METTIDRAPRFTTGVGVGQPGRGWVWPVTVALHALSATAVVLLPLLGDEPLPPENDRVANAFFAAPAYLAAPPPPPPPPAARVAAAAPVTPPEAPTGFTAPVEMPQELTAEPSLDLGLEGGVPGGVEGGVPGGVVGGVVGGLDEAPPPPPRVVRVGGVVREPRKVKDVAPRYPSLALNARVQGVVILECQISPQGRVETAKVLRSVPMLDEAAIEAVRQWVYTPTLVDGVPVSVVLTVTVNFVLRESMR
jgi:protein TonB